MAIALSLTALLALQGGGPAATPASATPAPATPAPATQAPATQAPAEPRAAADEFRAIGRALYDGDCQPYGAEPARTLERLLRRDWTEPDKRLAAVLDLGEEWLEMGRVSEAIALLEEALESKQPEPRGRKLLALHRKLGLAYLRLAENQNCVERHASSCCILPVTEGGVHRLRDAGLRAREHYQWVLEHTDSELGARWVLNLLARLLGDYPEGVPAPLRIPLPSFPGGDSTPSFRDVGARAGIDSLNLAGGVTAQDFDGDGWIDLLTSTCDPLGPLLYFRNRGNGTFEDRSAAAGTTDQLGGLNLISADYDNDGDPDAFVLRGAWLGEQGEIRNSLLRNEGGASFLEVTRAAGVADPACPTQAAVFADLDSDGWLDLYVGNESGVELGAGKGNYPSQLFLARGDGTFRDATPAAGVSNDRYAKGLAAGDYDDDGDLDLYVSNIGTNRLYRNDGKACFEDVAEAARVKGPIGRSFATWFFDQDEDGRLDLWVGGYAATIGNLAAEALGQGSYAVMPCLYRNLGNGTFVDVAAELGLARPMLPMGANFGDLDGDGWLDIALGTGDPQLQSLMPNLALRNVDGRRFEDVTAATGLGHLQKGHGIAFADFDRDGDQDIFQQLGGFVPVDRFQNALFENLGAERHWLALDLCGTLSNRDGIGARVRVVLETPAGTRELHRAVGAVSSFGGSPLEQEIGLGDARRILRLEIRWPRTKEPQIFTDVPMDAHYRVEEGTRRLVARETRAFRF